ncbi:hypothetical protein L2X98_29265 [Microbacterium elymi]|uniref:Uncharacterized protein n=1 Tax=Microbacterium elymi TaxID=2909587 RepID=A0ABY5NHL9_9MICO|nr:hypothetical protein [Microbacterium elymi]UUT34604.1 hypothetical protein L2X98_29265 [Microbacterium elymi]
MTWPVGYVVTVAIVAWCTFFACVAPRRPNLLAKSSWLFGMIVNEVPFLAIYFLIASTVLAASEGDLDSLAGRGAAGIAGLVIVGLVIVAWRGARSDRAVERALDRGLGADWRSKRAREATSAPALAAHPSDSVRPVAAGCGANQGHPLWRRRTRQPAGHLPPPRRSLACSGAGLLPRRWLQHGQEEP